jgi:UDP-glucose 4-epimerase
MVADRFSHHFLLYKGGCVMAILVTGGAGFIGSHTCVELLNNGKEVVVLDNLCNANPKSLERVREITGKDLKFYEGDIRDREILKKIFKENTIESVIHFAGLKAVGESVHMPVEYYDNNINGTLTLVDEMRKAGVKNIIFSSSATVYGNPAQIPITEECPKGTCTTPYGWTKWMIEQILTDLHTADAEWNVVLLRYFNPIGAHPTGLMGENPSGIPNNLMPYITQVAIGKLDHLNIFGNDYDTPDGTCVRDYIHVMDLASGHVAALKKLEPGSGVSIYNLGTGIGYSVLDIVNNFEKANDLKIPYEFAPRREGDVPQCYSDASKAERELGWKAKYGILEMCRDSWNWQKKNPNGYED